MGRDGRAPLRGVYIMVGCIQICAMSVDIAVGYGLARSHVIIRGGRKILSYGERGEAWLRRGS